jgi:hypothetical protein
VLACIGLKEDRYYVGFDDPASPSSYDSEILKEVQRRLKRLGRRLDFQLAGTWAMQLGLVDLQGNSVRFRHSIMQAYLGSRLIGLAMADLEYWQEALRHPGQELLTALVSMERPAPFRR